MIALQNIVNSHKKVAFLIGNGPNLAANIMPSWIELLTSVADRPIDFEITGLTNTEIYDLVELQSKNVLDVKERVKNKLELRPTYNLDIHRRLMEFAKIHSSPVLTTNFDEAFEHSVNAQLFHIESNGFTRYYPWKSYYGFKTQKLPTEGFGIWKIHGDVKYKDSIRLGLTDYMGSVERARKLIHKGDASLFRGKKHEYWEGHQTWLHIWFNLPIVIFGLGYGSDEVFLRWLLIERKRYMNLIREKMNVYYISLKNETNLANNFMTNLGVDIVSINQYSDIYGENIF